MEISVKLIKNYEYLVTLCIYNHTNPVKDGLVSIPVDWEYLKFPQKRIGSFHH